MAKRKHTSGKNPYFRVSGERRTLSEDGTTVVVLPPHTRFESMELGDAERHATGIFKSEGIVCEIHEHTR